MPVNILVTSPPHPDLEDDDADDEVGGGDSHKLWQATLSPAFQAAHQGRRLGHPPKTLFVIIITTQLSIFFHSQIFSKTSQQSQGYNL